MESEELPHLANLLLATFNSSEDAQRQQAEAQLHALSLDFPRFSHSLLSLISTPDTQPELKQSAALQLRHSLQAVSTLSSFAPTLRSQLTHAIFMILTTVSLPTNVTAGLAACFPTLIKTDDSDTQGSTCTMLLTQINHALTQSEIQIKAAMITVKTIFSDCDDANCELFGEFYKEITARMSQIAKICVEQLALGVQNSDQSRVFESLSILEEWISAVCAALEFFESQNSAELVEICSDFQLAEAISILLTLRLPDTTLAKMTLIAADITAISVLFNKVKSQAMRGVSVMMENLVEARKKREKENGEIGIAMPPVAILGTLVAVVEPLIGSLLDICNSPQADELLELDSVPSLIFDSLQMLDKCVSESVFFERFQPYSKPLVLNVCLRLLRVSLCGFSLFSSSPEEFASVALDVCEHHETHTLQTTAAHLLDTVSRRIDGVLPFLTAFLVQLLDFTISGQGIDRFPLLNELQGKANLISASEETRIETSLMAFCVLSEAILARNDLSILIAQRIVSHFPAIIAARSPLIHSRLCLFLYFYSELMMEFDRFPSICLEFLLSSLNPNSVHAVVHVQACAVLSVFVQNEGTIEKLQTYAEAIIAKMTEVIAFQREKTFFETFQELIIANPTAAVGTIAEMFAALAAKIATEQRIVETQHRKGKSSESILIFKCWNVIRTVLERKQGLAERIDAAENALRDTVEFLKDPEKIEFEDEIVRVWTEFVAIRKAVSPLGWVVFERFPLIQHKNEGALLTLFPALTAYLTHGLPTICSNPSYMSQIVEMSCRSLFAAPRGRISEVSNSEGAVVVHYLLLACQSSVAPHLPALLHSALARYSQGATAPFFKVRLLAVFLAAITSDIQITYDYLSPRKEFALLLSAVCDNANDFRHSHEKRIAVPALLSLVFGDRQVSEMESGRNRVFRAVVGILRAKDGRNTQKTDVKRRTKGGEASNSDDEINIESAIREAFYSHISDSKCLEAEANLTLSALSSPLPPFDEVLYFQSTLETVSKSSPDMLKTLIADMDESFKGELADIMRCKRVEINDVLGEKSTVRRVVRAKRRLRK